MFFTKNKFPSKKILERGFTVVELMVTVTIVVLVTGIIMVQYTSFNSSVLLTSQAYLIAFDIREAQSLAVSVRGQSDEFREEYGLFFDMTATDPNQYLLFHDDDTNGEQYPAQYQIGEALGAPYKLDPRFILSNICATNSSSRTCYADDPRTSDEVVNASFHDMAISFRRPDFDADFYSDAKSNIQSVELIVGTAQNAIVKKITIYSTGQISID